MNSKLLLSIPAAAFLIVVLFQGCTKDKTPRPAVSEPCDPNKIYFNTSIRPLITTNCAITDCHDAATQQDGVNLSTYEGIMEQVTPGRPQDSDLIEMINEPQAEDRMPPPPRPPLSQQQKDLLWNWVLQGADNSACEENSTCQPSAVSFSADIRPIISTNCIGCHSGSTLSGGVNLSTFSGVQTVAQSGKLYNAASQNGQATPMPPNGKLPPCDIQMIKVWIEEGTKNN